MGKNNSQKCSLKFFKVTKKPISTSNLKIATWKKSKYILLLLDPSTNIFTFFYNLKQGVKKTSFMKANQFIKKKFSLPFRYKLSILFIQLNSSTNLCVHFYQRSLLICFSSLMSKQSISFQVVRSYYFWESEILKWYLTSWG